MFADQYRLRRGRRCFAGEVGQASTRRLGEHRHGVGDVGGEIDVADIERFEQRQAAGELMPGHPDALPSQLALEGALAADQGQQSRGFLEADAQDLLGLCATNARQDDGSGKHDGQATQERTRHAMTPGIGASARRDGSSSCRRRNG